ncbi:pyridoxamine 5'-phosphate oxidase family protein [Sporolactobacillus putidus]|uniref:Pyridoxamine 5'-phosphate oxidase n=1 Tax=Sporolactobacillus putidus TaxID=492735 RepID=A0A917SAR9_9BACL|nr:pyridoxamine 5'-phosphate oxidase family protein [Sporolactobacillus putidus]GGL64863.1 pyridoxamine 5'-phosphate oxidase [Sporolactobacillus putidus]
MSSMRYQMRECENREKIDLFLTKARVGFLGLADTDRPYVVPLNYVWHNGRIYFHGADTGRKADIMNINSSACFTVCEEYGTMTHPVPAHTDTAYMSVILFGQVARISDLDEATEALQQMLDKYVPEFYNRPLSKRHVEKYRSSLGSAAAIFCLQPDQLSAKENPLDPGRKFVFGRRVNQE